MQTGDGCLSDELLASYRRLDHSQHLEGCNFDQILWHFDIHRLPWTRIHLAFNNFDSPLFFIIDFPDRSLQSMIKEKASDPALESRPLLSHPPYGWIWLNVSYCLGEIDGNQTPSLALRNVLLWVPHTDWLCARVCARATLSFILILLPLPWP